MGKSKNKEKEHPLFQQKDQVHEPVNDDGEMNEYDDDTDWKRGSLGGKSAFIMPQKLGISDHQQVSNTVAISVFVEVTCCRLIISLSC